ncbi:MAG: SDR family NAD(P)-dependent oxidoreductase [Cyanobacteria bacterium]|nr:SDR family NAD(P)-dependent oxidoreductase [Cyanobacteria bacterium bin.51]
MPLSDVKAEAAKVLVIGGGYSGLRFARAAAAQGMGVTLTRRQKAGNDASSALRWLVCDPERGLVPPLSELVGTTEVLVTVPPDRQGRDPVFASLAPLLAQLPLQWLGYLSTTGVYGDQAGGWVGEGATPRPGLPRSQARLACEQLWLGSGLPVQVFRLPAIYGPGRTPFQKLRDGSSRMIHKPGQVFSRIHVDDIASSLLFCRQLPAAQRPELLNLADDEPCPSSQTLGYAAHLLGCKLPAVESFDRLAGELSPMALSFWAENRRVSNRRLCRELGYQLRYPSYRQGYRACLAEELSGVSTPK